MEKIMGYSDYYFKISGKLAESYAHFTGTLAIIK
jgi:hypothetical protein